MPLAELEVAPGVKLGPLIEVCEEEIVDELELEGEAELWPLGRPEAPFRVGVC